MKQTKLPDDKKNGAGRIYIMRFFPPSINKIYADLKLSLDKILNYKLIRNHFKIRMGYELDLASPKSYNSKIFWKKIHDRNPLLTLTADKYRAREYIRAKLNKEEAEQIIIPVYFATLKPKEIPFDELPEKFVVKPNHGSKMHIIVKGDKNNLKDKIIRESKEWLTFNHGIFHYEWAYRNIKRLIIVEKLIECENGTLPLDYKFYCFHGKCKLIRVSKNRFGMDDVSAYYDENWNFKPVFNPGYEPSKTQFDKPANLASFIKIAEKLSEDFDAIRVDFYYSDGKIYFGEFTHYDGSGLARFEPQSFDFELGAHWKIEPKYWLKKAKS